MKKPTFVQPGTRVFPRKSSTTAVPCEITGVTKETGIDGVVPTGWRALRQAAAGSGASLPENASGPL